MIETEFRFIDNTNGSTKEEALLEIAYQLKRSNDIKISIERNKQK